MIGPWRLRLVLALALCAAATGYYLPGTFPQAWLESDELSAEVNSLTSFETELPFDYYSLPFCKPPQGIRPAAQNVNIGTFLTGQRLDTSPYNFTMMVDELAKEACDGEGFYGPLSKQEADNLEEKIREKYRVHIVLDNLPVTTYDLEEDPESVRTGFMVGFVTKSGGVYVNNHVMFKILVHPVTAAFLTARDRFYAAETDVRRRQLLEDAAENRTGGVVSTGGDVYYTVVGFEAHTCSVRREAGWVTHPVSCPGAPVLRAHAEAAEEAAEESAEAAAGAEKGNKGHRPQEVKEGEKIVYTYDIKWEVSEIKWVSRWDSYLQMPRGQVHWFSLLNSLLVVMLLSGVVAVIFLRTIRRDLAKFEELLMADAEGGGSAGVGDEACWKVIMGDVFRAPANPVGLSIMVGSGLQIFISSGLTLLIGALGFLSPAVRGALLSTLLGLYMILSTITGFVSVYLHSAVVRSHNGWVSVALKSTGSVPLAIVTILILLNLIIKHTGSTGAIPFSALLPISLMWMMVCFPLGYGGGILASRLPLLEYPTRTNPIPREIPNGDGQRSRLVFMFFGSGLLTFGNIFVELYFAMTSMWQGYFYYLLGFVLVVGFLTVIITVQIAVVTTYMQFCLEDYHWWWSSFHRGGSVAFYVFLYAIGFLIWSLHTLTGFTSIFVYLIYMSMLVGAIYLTLGSVGFAASFWFTYSIFSSAKAD